jgi:protein-S-isoprenylcysteine O-methyltransferase Ste14
MTAAERKRGVKRWVIRSSLAVPLAGAVVFVAAGRLDWVWAWMFVALLEVNFIALAVLLIPTRPELLAERSGLQAGTKRWDFVLAPLMAYGPLYTAVVAALDFRWGWSPPFPLAVHLAALVVAVAGWALAAWAMYANRFFAATVRIQTDRGHEVVSGGPYRLVRHPGYLGAAAFVVALPLMLGSQWALLPAAVGLLAGLLRTELEDQTLRRELPGYADYARRVRWRLVPGIW